MKTIAILSLLLFAGAAGRAEVARELAGAAKPLADGVPEVAVVRLRERLGHDLTDGEWQGTTQKLIEALLAAQQPAEALALLDAARARDLPESKFWRAQALASLHRPTEALALYEQVKNDPKSAFRANATFGAAEMLRELNRPDAAAQEYSKLHGDPIWGARARIRSVELLFAKGDMLNARRMLDAIEPKTAAERQEMLFLRGRLSISKRPDRAGEAFQAILQKPDGATRDVLIAALFGVAEANLQLKTPEAGDDALEDFIEHHPRDADLARIFAKLDELYRAEENPSRNELQRWIRDAEQPRKGFAQWYLARMEARSGRSESAWESFTVLRQSKPKEKEFASAFLEFAELAIERGKSDLALAILEEARALRPESNVLDRINMLAGQAQYEARQFDAAATTFEGIARSSSPLAKTSLINASLAWLQAGNRERFAADSGQLAGSSAGENPGMESRLEEALVQAARNDKNAAESLQSVLRDFPNDKRASEAWVALAELAFHATPPRLEEAKTNLARAAQANPTPTATERADYLMIWIEDAAKGSDAKVIEAANGFLDRHPTSALAESVRLKLAEEYYRRQDFSNAQTQFELLAAKQPAGPLGEKALFFAAKSAVFSMAPHALDHAITLFDQVVRLNGGMKWAARNEQAAIERKLGKLPDALSLYEEVLKNSTRPDEKREALCGKGDIFFEMGGSDAANYARAIEVYDELAASAEKQVQWRSQALFKKGVCQEKQANKTEALASFFQVLDSEVRPDRANELFWFYKAGFNAARLLEDSSKWQSAVSIYERLAVAGGPRSDEAKARLSRLRMEHFLWQE